MSRVISIVQCVSKKSDTPQPARDLCTSPLFVNAAEYAEKISDEWYILSAKYHLVHPSDWLEPYDVTFNKENPIDPASKDWLGHWANREKVRNSDLWNSNHVDEDFDPEFLTTLKSLIKG